MGGGWVGEGIGEGIGEETGKRRKKTLPKNGRGSGCVGEVMGRGRYWGRGGEKEGENFAKHQKNPTLR